MPTARGNIGTCFSGGPHIAFIGQFTRSKQPTSVTITITGAAGQVVLRTAAGAIVERGVTPSISGTALFFDVDNGSYIASDSIGNSWGITVSGSTVAVTKLGNSSASLVVAGFG